MKSAKPLCTLYSFTICLFLWLFPSILSAQSVEFKERDTFFKNQIRTELKKYRENPTNEQFNEVFIHLEQVINQTKISITDVRLLIEEVSIEYKNSASQIYDPQIFDFLRALIERARGNMKLFDSATRRIINDLNKKQNWKTIVFIHYSLAHHEVYLNSLPAAMNYLYQTENHIEKLSERDILDLRWHYVSNANTMGICYNRQGKTKEALNYFEIAHNRAVKTNLIPWIGITKGNIGGVLLETEEWKKGVEFLKEDIKISLESEIYESATNAMISVANAFLSNGNYELALKYADSCYHLFPVLTGREKMSNKILKSYLTLMGDIHFAKKEKEEAISYYKKAIDTLYAHNNELRKGISYENLNRYKIEDGVLKNIEIEKGNQLRSNLYVISSIIGFALLIIILIMWIYSKKLKEKNKLMNIQNERLELLNQEKSLFLSILSHDLRGPMIRMKGLLSLYNNNLLSQNDFQKNAIQVEKSIQSLLRMLENLLRWASTTTKEEVRLDIEPTQVKNIADEICLQLEPIYQEKEIQVVQRVEDDIWVMANKDALGTVLRNLLNNAIKFSNHGGYIAIYVSKPENDNYIRINVRDEGIGMSEQQVNLIMDSDNHNLSQDGTKGEKGFGVGLQLCKKFVAKMNGFIRVKSTPGQGSTFYFELPSA